MKFMKQQLSDFYSEKNSLNFEDKQQTLTQKIFHRKLIFLLRLEACNKFRWKDLRHNS